jgi:hypothetical protein
MDIIHEKRSNPELNPKVEPIEELRMVFDKHGFDNTYISFREGKHITDINPKNKYGTPTGFYTYPTRQMGSNLKQALMSGNMDSFRKLFPFASDRAYVYIFIPNPNAVILNSQTTEEETRRIVSKIADHYATNYNHAVGRLCEKFLENEYNSSYSDYDAAHFDHTQLPAHKLWLFLYDVGLAINKGKAKNVFTKLCYDFGIDGFEDDKGFGWIHSAEKFQAVFFRVKNIGTMYQINTSEGQRDFSFLEKLPEEKVEALINAGRLDKFLKDSTFVNHLIGLYSWELFASIPIDKTTAILSVAKHPSKTNVTLRLAIDKGYFPNNEEIAANTLIELNTLDKKAGFKPAITVDIPDDILRRYYNESYEISERVWKKTPAHIRDEVLISELHPELVRKKYMHPTTYRSMHPLLQNHLADSPSGLHKFFEMGGEVKEIITHGSEKLQTYIAERAKIVERILGEDKYKEMEVDDLTGGTDPNFNELLLIGELTPENINAAYHQYKVGDAEAYNSFIKGYNEKQKLNESTIRLYDLFNKLNNTDIKP